MTIEQLLERLIEDGCYTLDDSDSVPFCGADATQGSGIVGEIPPVKEETDVIEN